jgi:hypothetical protein
MASLSNGAETGIKRIVTAKRGFARRRGPAKISVGCEAPPPEGKIQLKENKASYCQPLWRDSTYWPVIFDLSPIDDPERRHSWLIHQSVS